MRVWGCEIGGDGSRRARPIDPHLLEPLVLGLIVEEWRVLFLVLLALGIDVHFIQVPSSVSLPLPCVSDSVVLDRVVSPAGTTPFSKTLRGCPVDHPEANRP